MTHPIPAAALAHHIAFLGKTGSGKSNGAKVVAEDALDAGERVCIIDPTGSWWGLRLKANGKPSCYSVVIFGGLHADVPISSQNGAAVAEVIATSATPAVIDTRLLTVGQRTQFFTDFAETLLRKNRGPLRLIIDEAHVFAPQGRVSDPNSGKMLHAANNLVSLGRSIGLRIIMISQRPAKLHKDSLTQIETLIAMRLIGPQDRAAVEDWIGEWADKAQGKEIIASLPSLPTGDAWIWSPEVGFLERVHFPLATTYDSGKAPEGTENSPELKPLDIATVNQLLEKASADLKANDPRHLQAEVARLTRELAAAQKGKAAPEWPDQREEVEALKHDLERVMQRERVLLNRVEKIRAVLREDDPNACRLSEKPTRIVAEGIASPKLPTKPTTVLTARPGADHAAQSDGSVPSGCAKPLAALAGAYPAGLSEAQWAMVAGYKKTGGTWNEYRRRLQRADMIEQRDGRWFATELGAHAAGPVELPPAAGPDLVRWWAPRINAPMRVVEHLIKAYPGGHTRAELAEHVGMAVGGGSFQEYVRRLLRNSVAEERDGVVRLSDEVMGG